MDKLIGNYRFNMNHQIGRGSYGIVYQGKSYVNGQPIAIKVIDKKLINKENVKQLLNEIESMRNLNHNNVVRFLDYYETPNNIYIIQEYCDEGDLRDLIKKGKSDCAKVLNILQQILSGYYELYKQNIIHRDIKPANILIHKGVIKLGDFGFAKRIDYENDLMTSVAGTPLYMAPQLLLRQQYTSKCDIWSIGMILYELLFQKPPIKATNLLELQDQISKPIQVPQLEDPHLQDIIQRCLQVSEEKRIGWDELYQDASLQGQDYYMKQIDNYCNPQNPQEQEVCSQQQDYRKHLINDYLMREFQKNYYLIMNHLEYVRSIVNFSTFVYAQQVKHEVVKKLFILLRTYALRKIEELENPIFLSEFQPFMQSDMGIQAITQVISFKSTYLSYNEDVGDLDELVPTLEFACEQIQQLQISHSKLVFLVMGKFFLKCIKCFEEMGKMIQLTVMDIQYIQTLPDQELLTLISQL